MKTKTFYLICFILVLGTVLVSVIVVAKPAFESAGVTERRIPLLLPATKGPNEEVVARMMRLEPLLESLARPRMSQGKEVHLEAFGYRSVGQVSGHSKGRKMRLKRQLRHSISFAFCGGMKCFCVVDGTFYPEGAVLVRGGKILRILPRKVLIEEGRVRKWFPVGAGMKKTGSETEPGREK